MAIRGYTSPGVSVVENSTPAIAPLIANPSVLAIVGAASGSQAASERILLSGTTATQLKYTGVNTGSIVVRAVSDNSVINPGNYSITAGTDPDPSVLGDIPTLIARWPAPATAPTVSNAGTGTLVGTYVYAVSFVNPAGETGIGPASTSVVFATAGANLSAIPVDTTPSNGTTARNVYRAKVVGGVTGTFNLVATVSGNVTTTLTNETTLDATAALAATPKSGIADGDTVTVTYNYTDQNYYDATFFADYDDIVDKYGTPFDASGNINSALSFAARIAFQNGASEIIAVASVSAADTDVSSALSKLESETEVRIVVTTSGSANVHSALAAHLTNMNSQGLYRQGIVGRDGVATALDAPTLRAAAKAFNNEALVMVSPANFVMQNPVTGRDLSVGAQYAASAIAGMLAARDVQVPLTRKSVASFTRLGDKRTPTEQALDSQAGLMVIVDKGGVLQIRHQVTTAVSNVNTAEVSVIRAKYEMGHRLRDTLDGSIVGTVIPQNLVPQIVGGVVTGILEQLQVEGAITAYGNVKARVLATDVTTVEVRFEYLPAFPINNVIVSFTINTNNGAFDLTTV